MRTWAHGRVWKERGLWGEVLPGLNPSQLLSFPADGSPRVPHPENGIVVSEFVRQQVLDNSEFSSSDWRGTQTRVMEGLGG